MFEKWDLYFVVKHPLLMTRIQVGDLGPMGPLVKLMNLLNLLRKSNKMRGLPSFLSFFRNSLINSLKRALM